MKFTANIRVQGLKASKGQLENGTPYDSTKVYVETDLDDSKGMGVGTATAEYAYGTSENFHEFKRSGVQCPFDAQAELEVVTNGKTQKTVILSIKPVAQAKRAA